MFDFFGYREMAHFLVVFLCLYILKSSNDKPNATNQSIYFMKAAKTAHMSSLVPCLHASASMSRSNRSLTLFMATS